MLRVEQNPLAGADEEGDRVADHRQVLLARGPHDLLDVQDRCLADERAYRRETVRENAQALVLLGGRIAAPGHTEGNHLGDLEPLASEQAEELLLLRVGRGEARLDHVDAELVERVNHAQLLLGGEGQAASPHAVAQGGVV